jgi:hypothetical protein
MNILLKRRWAWFLADSGPGLPWDLTLTVGLTMVIKLWNYHIPDKQGTVDPMSPTVAPSLEPGQQLAEAGHGVSTRRN